LEHKLVASATPGSHRGKACPQVPDPEYPATTNLPEAPVARDGRKKAAVLALIRRPEGATLAELMEATGWQAHSVRGFLSGTVGKKMGLMVESFKAPQGERTYRIC